MATSARTPNTTRPASARALSRGVSSNSRRSSPAVEVIDPASLVRRERQVRRACASWSTRRPTRSPTYQIVGVYEADIKQERRLSISSPLAKALIGKKAGDSISVPAPGGDRTYEIL